MQELRGETANVQNNVGRANVRRGARDPGRVPAVPPLSREVRHEKRARAPPLLATEHPDQRRRRGRRPDHALHRDSEAEQQHLVRREKGQAAQDPVHQGGRADEQQQGEGEARDESSPAKGDQRASLREVRAGPREHHGKTGEPLGEDRHRLQPAARAGRAGSPAGDGESPDLPREMHPVQHRETDALPDIGASNQDREAGREDNTRRRPETVQESSRVPRRHHPEKREKALCARPQFRDGDRGRHPQEGREDPRRHPDAQDERQQWRRRPPALAGG